MAAATKWVVVPDESFGVIRNKSRLIFFLSLSLFQLELVSSD